MEVTQLGAFGQGPDVLLLTVSSPGAVSKLPGLPSSQLRVALCEVRTLTGDRLSFRAARC